MSSKVWRTENDPWVSVRTCRTEICPWGTENGPWVQREVSRCSPASRGQGAVLWILRAIPAVSPTHGGRRVLSMVTGRQWGSSSVEIRVRTTPTVCRGAWVPATGAPTLCSAQFWRLWPRACCGGWRTGPASLPRRSFVSTLNRRITRWAPCLGATSCSFWTMSMW